MRFKCSVCIFETQRFLTLISHNRHGHNDAPVHCCIDGCQKLLSSSRTYLQHIKSKHHEFWSVHCTARVAVPHPVPVADIDDDLDQEVINIGDDNYELNEDDLETDVNHEVSRILLGLREELKTSSAACEYVASNVAEIINSYRKSLSRKFTHTLQQEGLDMNLVDQMGLSDESQYEKAFDEFATQASLEKYVSEHSDFVQPIEYILGQNAKGNDETMQYVPIIQTLQALLRKDDVFAEVYNGHFSSDETLQDFCDGTNFKDNVLFSTNNMALQIQFYFDEFCIGNPLGTKVKQMKLAGFYYVLGNISPQYRSKLHVIQLVSLCMASHMKTYGMNAILAPMLRDVQKLETQGICVKKDDVEFRVFGTISFISADNLASHLIGGYQTHFHSGRVCRHCNVTHQTLKDDFSCQRLQERTKDAYEQQLQVIEVNPAMRSVYGLTHNSVLNQLLHFHVTSGLPGDIAHDIFEGVIPEVIRMTILHCVQQEYFSLEHFNGIVHTFNYGETDCRNKPSPMSSDVGTFKVKQTACQAWCLLRHLPMMVGYKVPHTDERWQILLLLLDVVEYCVAPKVNKVMCEFLSYLLELFMSSYYTQYEVTMKPKFHYLLHYPQLMMQYGPLVYCWTLRFEAKHFAFKEISWRTKNRKNIVKTLAERHEYYQAWYRSTKEQFLTQEAVEHTGGKLVHVRTLTREMQQAVVPLLGGSEYVYVAKKVAKNGVWYASGSAVILDKVDDDYKFGIITTGLIISGVVFLVCAAAQTTDYVRHVHAYAISEVGRNVCIVRVTELYDYYPLSIYETNFSKLVTLRHHVL